MAKVAPLHKIGVALDPQAADPASPRDGQLQMSDGTHRAKGLWRYNDATTSWVSIGATVFKEDLAVYSQSTAEDADLTGTSNIATTAVDPISGSLSYTVTSYPASFPVVTLNNRSKDRVNGLELHYKIASGTAKVVIKDQLSATLAELDLDSTSIKKELIEFTTDPTTTSIQIEIQDVSSATDLVIDDIILTDSPFSTNNTSDFLYSGANLLTTTGTIRFGDVGFSIQNEDIIQYDETTGRFNCNRDGTLVTGSITLDISSAAATFDVDKNGIFLVRSNTTPNLSTYKATVAFSVILNNGDYLTVGTLASLTNSASDSLTLAAISTAS